MAEQYAPSFYDSSSARVGNLTLVRFARNLRAHYVEHNAFYAYVPNKNCDDIRMVHATITVVEMTSVTNSAAVSCTCNSYIV